MPIPVRPAQREAGAIAIRNRVTNPLSPVKAKRDHLRTALLSAAGELAEIRVPCRGCAALPESAPMPFVSNDVRRHHLISISYISVSPCHRPGANGIRLPHCLWPSVVLSCTCTLSDIILLLVCLERLPVSTTPHVPVPVCSDHLNAPAHGPSPVKDPAATP